MVSFSSPRNELCSDYLILYLILIFFLVGHDLYDTTNISKVERLTRIPFCKLVKFVSLMIYTYLMEDMLPVQIESF